MKYTALLISGFLFLLPSFVLGQITAPNVGGSIELRATPAQPDPRETVDLRISLFGPTLDVTSIEWYANGILFDQNTETTSYTIGDVGERTTIEVVGRDTRGNIFSERRVFTPSSIILTYEADSYTPPFYEGGAHLVKEGSATVYAYSNHSSSNTYFKWFVNNELQPTESGIGRNSFTYQGTLIHRPTDIRVELLDRQNNPLGQESLTLTFSDPLIRAYENNALYGILFNQALQGNAELTDREITAEAIPYFFSDRSDLAWQWRLNSSVIDTDSSVTLRNENNESGRAQVSVSAESSLLLLQSARTSFSIDF